MLFQTQYVYKKWIVAMVAINTDREPLPVNCMVEGVTKLEEAFMCIPDAVEKTLMEMLSNVPK
jgi:hypothetical protein